MKAPFLLGRMIFGGFFLYNGFHHFKEYKEMAQYAGAKGVPAPEVAVLGTGVALTAGGASILLGAKPRLGSLAILGFLAGVSPFMHDFWNEKDPGQKQNSQINFMKNMALLGGALALFGVEEPWPVSVTSHGGEEVEAGDEDEGRPLRLSQRRVQQRKAA